MALAKAGSEAVQDEARRAGAPSELHGTALRLFRVLWWSVFAAIMAATLVSPFYVAQGLKETYRLYAEFGVEWNNPTKSLWPVSEEATRAGLVPRSPVVAINGERVRDEARPEEYVPRILAAPGDSVQLGIRLPGGGERAVRLARLSDWEGKESFLSWMGTEAFFWVSIGFAIQSLVALTAAFLLFRRRPNDLVVAWLSLALVLLQLIYGPANFVAPAVLGTTGLRIAFALSGTLLAMGLTMFPESSLGPRWSRGVRAVIALLGVASAATAIAAGATETSLYGFFVVQLLLLASVLIVRYRRLPPGTMRQQIRWAFLGFALFVPMTAVGIVIIILASLIAPSSPISLPNWTDGIGTFLVVVAPTLAWIGLLISLLRYRLYDADTAISRSVSFGALALLFVALFAGTERVIELLGEEYLGENLGVLAGGIGAAVAALMIVPLHHRFSHWAERKFQKQLIQLRHGLPALVGDMRETAPAERIAAAALDWVGRGVRASRAALIMEDAVVQARGIDAREIKRWRKGWTPALQPGLDCVREDAVFPLRIPLEADGHGRVGWLLLGPRPDGSFYGKDERETLAAIADPVARALEIAAARDKREAAEGARWQGQESLNAELKTVNTELVRVLGSLDRKLEQLLPAAPQTAAE